MHQKRKTSRVHASSHKLTKKYAMKMKQTKKQEKNDGHLKYFYWKEGVYKARAENSCNGYQMTSAQRFLIH